jgi:hypothetical protein
MTRTVRLLAAAAITAGGLLLSTAPAHAIIDPSAVLGCLTESATGATAVLGGAGGGVPELPAVNCLQP